MGLKQLRLRASSLPHLTGVARLEQSGDTFTLHTPDTDALVRELVRKEVDFSGLEVRPSSLEEAFLSLTKGAPHETGLSPHQS
ncbi:MAG: hypothetical protein RML14_00355 [Meiothermus sp.]|uniref:hypothetical protein n=1 Tax=Meiothermus sp. TaxID=1955249 RepID=UPI00298ED6D2|nr:hypothetical protein [Meiothermus sp.]MDW8480372.1 hypothetical protein [Meiothermus sp.]